MKRMPRVCAWLALVCAGVPSGCGKLDQVVQAGLASAPPSDYLVVDVSAGPAASNYPVSALTAAPADGWKDEYKTTKIVLRRIPAGAFTMGSLPDELGHGGDETLHQVTLTQDFYICVFEVSQGQWERVMGNWPSWFNNAGCRSVRPVEQVSYADIRGAGAGTNWPAANSVDAASFMGKLRAKTGKAFDLPTEAQWEYACRAGTATALNSGKSLAATGNDPNMSEVGRYLHNGGNSYKQSVDASGATAKAGSYLPNAWGLYDMHGNTWEWCLDWYGEYPGPTSDPKGASSGPSRVVRGGSWNYRAYGCRSAVRYGYTPGFRQNSTGFRAVML